MENLSVKEENFGVPEYFNDKVCTKSELNENCEVKCEIKDIPLEFSGDENSVYFHEEFEIKEECPATECVPADAEPAKSDNSKLEKFQCPFCSYYSYCRGWPLEYHIQSTHCNAGYQKVHKCTQCDFVGNLKSQLTIHINKVHKKKKRFRCHLCKYSISNNEEYLKIHLEKVHSIVDIPKKYKCYSCSYTASAKEKLKLHIEFEHLKLKTLQCDKCDFVAKYMKNLTNHVNSVHLGKFKCVLCDFTTNRKPRFKEHTERYHMKMRKFKCFHCFYDTPEKGSLKRHIQSLHFNMRRYKCEHCSFSTDSKARFGIHLKTHTNLQK